MKKLIGKFQRKIAQVRQGTIGKETDEIVPGPDGISPPENHAAATVSFPDISHVLHDARSAFLREMPRVNGTILSAGCAGTWYFDWVASRTGHSARHIGIEFYSEKPEDLPVNVDWIENTVGCMTGVQDEECDLVFSGENLEHLWPEDVVGFFLESWRVLKPEAWLIVDSPNRLVTEPLIWSHPEHTIEFTPDEARRLAEASGFSVTSMKGIWICRDPDSGRILPLDPNSNVPQWPAIERCTAAATKPDHSLIWWMEAKKTGMPDPDKLSRAVQDMFDQAWPERSRRFLSIIGASRPDKSGFESSKGDSGVLVYGPYMPLKAGRHSATFALTADGYASEDEIIARIDIIGIDGIELAVSDLRASDLISSNSFRLDIELAELQFGIQARCISTGAANLMCKLPVITSSDAQSRLI